VRTAVLTLCLLLVFAWLVFGLDWDPDTAMWAVANGAGIISIVGILIVMALSDDPREILAIYTEDSRRWASAVRRLWRWLRRP
jgi:hypothetical protein